MDLLSALCVFPLAWAGLMLPVWGTRVARTMGSFGSLLALAGCAVLTQRVAQQGSIPGWNGQLRADALSAGILDLTAFLFCLVCLYSGPYLDEEVARGHLPARWAAHFWPIIYVFFGTMAMLCLADNLGIMWVSMELTTLTTVPLVCLSGQKRSLEAAWKYFVLCSVGIAMALIATVFIYASTLKSTPTGSGSLCWSAIAAQAKTLDPLLVRLGFLFALAGYGCKMGLVPFHCWLPDAHSEAPTPVSALLSGVLLNCASYALLRFHTIAAGRLGEEVISSPLLAFGLISVVVAAFSIVAQRDLKRLLAYSSVEHMGIVAVGLSLGKAGVYAALFHAVNHAAAKTLLFLTAGQVLLGYRTKQLARIQGLLGAARPTALALGVGSLAIVGLPPFALFLSEFLILRAAFLSGHTVTGVVLIGALTLTFAGFLAHLIPALCGDRPRDVAPFVETKRALLVLTVLAVVSMSLGITMPAWLDRSLKDSTRIITGG